MKKLVKYFLFSVIAIFLLRHYCSHKEFDYCRLSHDNQQTISSYSMDSIDLFKMIGDSCKFQGLQETFLIHDDVLICYVRKKDIPYQLRQSILLFAMFDLKKKEFVKYLSLPNNKVDNDAIIYPVMSIEKNKLYISCFENSKSIATIDLSTDEVSWKKIDGCFFKSSVAKIVRFGEYYYQLGKPYCAGVIDWKSGKCVVKVDSTVILSSDDNGYIAKPIGTDINLFKIYSANGLDFYQAYTAGGKKLWERSFATSSCAVAEDYFIVLSGQNLICLNKGSGSIEKKIRVEGAENTGVFNIENNKVWICSQMDNDTTRSQTSISGLMQRNYLMTLIDLLDGKVIRTEYLDTWDTQEYRLGEFYITQRTIGQPFEDTIVGQSYLIERVYSMKDMKKIAENKYYYIKSNSYKDMGLRKAIELNFLDNWTGKKYVLSSKGVLFW